jgi:hypothetical protein
MLTIKAQPPVTPSEDFEPVDQGQDTIELTEAAIKVSASHASSQIQHIRLTME